MIYISGDAIVELVSFGITPISNLRLGYCKNLVEVPKQLPPFITSLESMFEDAISFNSANITYWDTTSITNMEGMFQNVTSFNQDISGWNTSNVVYMEFMFRGASAFNQPIGNWDVSKVTSLRWMFSSAEAFNQPIGNWDVSNVTDMVRMFFATYAFNQDLSQWCVPLILTTPFDFSNNSTLASENTPVWGTCPRGENVV